MEGTRRGDGRRFPFRANGTIRYRDQPSWGRCHEQSSVEVRGAFRRRSVRGRPVRRTGGAGDVGRGVAGATSCTGAEAKAGSNVSVQYVGVNFADCKQFDASWDRQSPLPFKLGAQQVIPGWDQGVVGMKVGGRRELIIPPDLGYGPNGQGPIQPNETLVFVVDLVSVT